MAITARDDFFGGPTSAESVSFDWFQQLSGNPQRVREPFIRLAASQSGLLAPTIFGERLLWQSTAACGNGPTTNHSNLSRQTRTPPEVDDETSAPPKAKNHSNIKQSKATMLVALHGSFVGRQFKASRLLRVAQQ